MSPSKDTSSNPAPTIGAIPTTYQGVTYRSRLEARWSIFFDQLSITHQYEAEGYTDGLTSYLPDFWLPDQDCFWEVKPTPEYDGAKIEMLVRVTKKTCYTSFGMPSADSGEVGDTAHMLEWIETPEGEDENEYGIGWDNCRSWCGCPHCGRLGIEFQGRGGRICRGSCHKWPKDRPWHFDEDENGRYKDIRNAAMVACDYQFTTGTSPHPIKFKSGLVFHPMPKGYGRR